ncbi:MAG: PAS domain S-box protein [Chloroflexi bacterium]|nr:PAS domain S-box protein [Chloroflexota bacterium]
MTDTSMNNKQDQRELEFLRQRVPELEASETKRRQEDDSLKKRELFNFSLFQFNPVPTVIVDREGKVVKSNLAKRRSGDRIPEIGDQMYIDYAARHEIDMRAELMSCITSGNVREFPELNYGDKVLSVTICPFLDGAMIMSWDITERKRAEEELRESEARFRTIFENANDEIVLLNSEGTIVDRNVKGEDLVGYCLDEVVGKNISELGFTIPEERVPAMTELFVKAMNGGKGRGLTEVKLIHKNGHRVLVEASVSPLKKNGKVEGILVILRDITERKEAETALQHRENRFRSLIENSSDVIMVLNAETVIEYCSPSIERMQGYKMEEMLGRNAFDFVHPDQVSEAMKVFAHGIQIPGYTAQLELNLQRKDGEWITVELVGKNLVNDSSVGGVVLNFRDITEYRRAEAELQELLKASEEKKEIITASHTQLQQALQALELTHEELKKSQEQLLQSEKLAAIGQLVSGVAHELNNPLMAIYVCTELMLRYVQDETTKRDLHNLHADTERAIAIVRNLLSFARKQEPERKPISVNECIQSVLSLRMYELRLDNIEVVEELDPSLPRTMADYQQLQQVFLNLLINSEQAMKDAHDGGQVVIRTEKTIDSLHITFADNGPGIPQYTLSRIFEPFFTTKEVGEGTGLGLSICYGIIKEHGGKIRAHGNENGGTTFAIELPITTDVVSALNSDRTRSI